MSPQCAPSTREALDSWNTASLALILGQRQTQDWGHGHPRTREQEPCFSWALHPSSPGATPPPTRPSLSSTPTPPASWGLPAPSMRPSTCLTHRHCWAGWRRTPTAPSPGSGRGQGQGQLGAQLRKKGSRAGVREVGGPLDGLAARSHRVSSPVVGLPEQRQPPRRTQCKIRRR